MQSNAPILLDMTAASKLLGVSIWVTRGIKVCGRKLGDSPFFGRYTTQEKLLNWLERHPDFVASHFLRRTGPRLPRKDRRASSAGKSREPVCSSGPRRPSPAEWVSQPVPSS